MRQCLLAVEPHSANGITYALLGLPGCGLLAEQRGLGDVLAVLGGIGLIVQVGFDLGHDTGVSLFVDLHEEGEDQKADDDECQRHPEGEALEGGDVGLGHVGGGGLVDAGEQRVGGKDHEVGAQCVVGQRLAEVTECKGGKTAFIKLFWGSAVDDDISVSSFPVILTAGRTALALISVVEQDNALPMQSKTITKCII